jgi:hypothetical protein
MRIESIFVEYWRIFEWFGQGFSESIIWSIFTVHSLLLAQGQTHPRHAMRGCFTECGIETAGPGSARGPAGSSSAFSVQGSAMTFCSSISVHDDAELIDIEPTKFERGKVDVS